MQSLTVLQSDAILDVVQQCWTVGAAYEQRQANPKDEKAAKRYQQEVEMLTEFYVLAVKAAVHDDVLTGVLLRNLPKGLKLTIERGKAVT